MLVDELQRQVEKSLPIISNQDFNDALQSLEYQSLIEHEKEDIYFLIPVIRKYVTGRIVQQAKEEIASLFGYNHSEKLLVHIKRCGIDLFKNYRLMAEEYSDQDLKLSQERRILVKLLKQLSYYYSIEQEELTQILSQLTTIANSNRSLGYLVDNLQLLVEMCEVREN